MSLPEPSLQLDAITHVPAPFARCVPARSPFVRWGLITLVASTALFCASSIPGESSPYVGLRVPPIPADHEDLGGSMLRIQADSEYAIAEVSSPRGRMWWLQKLISRDRAGKPSWEVVAVMPEPDIPRGHVVAMAGLCERGGVEAPEVIAVVKGEQKARLRKIHRAWFVNVQTHKFEPYPTHGLTCINEGFGA
ncbi:hypothetical protein [Ramlibacter albus]|uniref:Uncharacterized protein n=1 Tax=Ramlibacter albus TaxID=2079448 RepID=A0A923ME85_9BURK|nr:hypothetical protein [Ramlibacter albus]MBC5767684.1 hypothetical protein [Ramlibacter albus]